LSFMVSSPMLNITGLILAVALLPFNYAILRIVGGIVVGVLLTYLIARIAARWVVQEAENKPGDNNIGGIFAKGITAYNRIFQFENFYCEENTNSPTTLISNWMGMVWRLARVVVPMLLIGAILASYVVSIVPDSGNNIIGVIVTSIFGTLMMVPTWTEIPLAAGFISEGLPGIAAVVIITLPAVSIPSLVIAAGAIRSFKVVTILALGVIMAGIIAGVIFL